MKCYINRREVPIEYTTVMEPPYNGLQKCRYIISTAKMPLEIRVEYDRKITSAVVRPLSAGIACTVCENKVSFTVTEEANISLEINGGIKDCLFFFLSRKEEIDFGKYRQIIRFEKEPEYTVDELKVTQDDTLIYIAEGTTVNGKILAQKVRNLKVCGNGILTMKNYTRYLPEAMTRCVEIRSCENVEISDISILDSSNWSLRLDGCDRAQIKNVKIIGCRGNADGIDICGSRQVQVTGCFIRTYDDSLVVKAFDTGNVEDVLFEKCVLWNDMARPMEIGVELRCEEVKNVIFRDIDVIHSLTCYPVFGIHHGDRAELSYITFQKIRIEHAPGVQLFDFRITDSVWNQDSTKGKIRDIFIDEISLVGEENKDFRSLHARIDGFDEKADIQNVHIGEIQAFGKRICGSEMLGLEILGAVKGVFWEKEQETEEQAEPVKSSLEIVEAFHPEGDGRYHGKGKLRLENSGKRVALGNAGVHTFPKNKAETDAGRFSYRLEAGESTEVLFEVIAQPGKLVLESFGDNICFRPCIRYFSLPYLLPETVWEAPAVRFDNYYGDRDGEIFFALKNGWLEVYSALLKEYDILLYTALSVPACDNEILFSAEESYFGEAPSVKWKNESCVPAPEIGNHWEITYVFQNQPKVKKIEQLTLAQNPDGRLKVPMESFGFSKDTEEFWLEAELKKHTEHTMPYTLFRSTLPEQTAHMFCRFIKNNVKISVE